MDLKVFIAIFQKMIWLIGVWATIHEIFAIEISKSSVKILILDQIAFAAVVCFGQVFGFCRLINKTLLEWFLLIMCKWRVLWPDLPFVVETIPHCFWLRREDRQMPPEVYCQKVSEYSQENTCVEVSFKSREALRPATLLKRASNTDVTL